VFQERQMFGRFYYRFPNGEAGTDVYDRMASFITYLFRTMTESGYFERRSQGEPPRNYVLVRETRIYLLIYTHARTHTHTYRFKYIYYRVRRRVTMCW